MLPALKQTASGTVTSDHPAHKIWSTSFVVVQVALSLVLLVGAMLFVRTLTNLQRSRSVSTTIACWCSAWIRHRTDTREIG